MYAHVLHTIVSIFKNKRWKALLIVIMSYVGYFMLIILCYNCMTDVIFHFICINLGSDVPIISSENLIKI